MIEVQQHSHDCTNFAKVRGLGCCWAGLPLGLGLGCACTRLADCCAAPSATHTATPARPSRAPARLLQHPLLPLSPFHPPARPQVFSEVACLEALAGTPGVVRLLDYGVVHSAAANHNSFQLVFER